jgi:dTMP kinase
VLQGVVFYFTGAFANMSTFIVFEGGEGCGKTTQIELLSNFLRSQNKLVTLSREPGGTPFAEEIRKVFKQVSLESPTALCELYLILSARAQHIQKVVNPFLASVNKNEVLICDRFLDSTYAYQGVLRGLDKNIIDSLSLPIVNQIIPAITFFLDCSPEVGMNRLETRKNKEKTNADRLDNSNLQEHRLIFEGYQKILNEQWCYPNGKVPKRVRICTEDSIENISKKIQKEVQSVFLEHA